MSDVSTNASSPGDGSFYTPDGSWFWTGSEWVAAPQGHGAPLAQVAPEPWWRDRQSVPNQLASGVGLVLVLVLVLLVFQRLAASS